MGGVSLHGPSMNQMQRFLTEKSVSSLLPVPWVHVLVKRRSMSPWPYEVEKRSGSQLSSEDSESSRYYGRSPR